MQNRRPKTHWYWSPLARRISMVLAVSLVLTYFQRDAVIFAEDKKEPFVNVYDKKQLTVSDQLFAQMVDTASSNLIGMIEIPNLIAEPEPEPKEVEETVMEEEEVIEEPVAVSEEKVPRYQVYDEDTMTWVLMPDENWECYLRDKCVDVEIEEFIPVLMIQLWEESRFKPDAISPGGDHGLAQINTCNHSRLRKELGITDFLDPYQSIDCQIYMMAPAIKEYGIEKALSLYNTGKVVEHTPYSDNIMRQYYEDYCVLSSNY